MKRYSVIAFNLHSTRLNNLNEIFVDETLLPERLNRVKKELQCEGLMYLATCNRLEFILSSCTDTKFCVSTNAVPTLLSVLHPDWKSEKIAKVSKMALLFKGEEAVKHVMEVASSLDSLVVGEREIITQFRNAYDWSQQHGLTDDFIRILNRKTVETAKKVYTDTKIAEKPISVMSLACRKLQEWHIGTDSRLIMIGAGQTADIMVKYLSKHGFTKFVVFNRNLKNAKELERKYRMEAHSLKDLDNYDKGFDVLITCAKSAKPLVNMELFEKLCNGEQTMKTIVDLGLPYNVDKKVRELKNVQSVTTDSIESVAKSNLEERKAEINAANTIIAHAVEEFYKDLQGRKVEVAMREVPDRVKKIRETAITSVFSKEIGSLSPSSREVLDHVVDYLEKKYISIPYQLAKEILLDKEV